MDEKNNGKEKKMDTKIVLYGYGMVTPRLGEPYTFTIQFATIFVEGVGVEKIADNETGRVRLGEILGRKPIHYWDNSPSTYRFTHTFSKITYIEDTGKPGKKGVIRIKGISPKIDGNYVEAEIDYPNIYSPPTII